MPELPEVERVRASLEPLVGRTVVRARLRRRDVLVVPGDPPGGFSRTRETVRPKRYTAGMLLADARIEAVLRHGKQLAIAARRGAETPILAGHLGMTGRFLLIEPGRRVAAGPHVHAEWSLDDGTRLRFEDPRRFGGLWALPSRDALRERWSVLGVDPLAVDDAALARALERGLSVSRRAIKAALLDQRVVAGVGNIYADESLWAACIAPDRLGADLAPSEHRKLAEAIRAILSRSLEAGGSTLRDYRDASGEVGSFQAQHAVYGRGGFPCPRCGATLVSGVLGQRSTVSCPQCQI